MTDLPRLTQFDFHHVLGEQPGLSVVLFTKPGCSSCKQWRRLLVEYRAQAPQARVFAVDAEEDAALAREFELFHLPALFLFRDGRYHAALQSEARLPALRAAIAAAALGPAQDAP